MLHFDAMCAYWYLMTGKTQFCSIKASAWLVYITLSSVAMLPQPVPPLIVCTIPVLIFFNKGNFNNLFILVAN